MNVVEHPSFEIVRTDDVPEYGAACIIAFVAQMGLINTADKNLLDMTV
jgi:hypothetical protein